MVIERVEILKEIIGDLHYQNEFLKKKLVENHSVSKRQKIHTCYPFYGFRRIRNELRNYGFNVGKKLVIRLMKLMVIEVVYPKQNTSVPN